MLLEKDCNNFRKLLQWFLKTIALIFGYCLSVCYDLYVCVGLLYKLANSLIPMNNSVFICKNTVVSSFDPVNSSFWHIIESHITIIAF